MLTQMKKLVTKSEGSHAKRVTAETEAAARTSDDKQKQKRKPFQWLKKKPVLGVQRSAHNNLTCYSAHPDGRRLK